VRKASTFCRADRLVAVACLTLVALVGCGSGGNATSASSTSSKPHKSKSTASKPGEEKIGEMVAAVSSAKAGPPVEMRFSLVSRPEVGQVMEVSVVLIPRAPVPDSFAASFQAAEGLEIVDGAQLDRVEKLVAGEPVRHVLKILPKRDGIFALSAVVTYTQADQDVQRTFSIPVIAGEGLPEQVAKGS
jgi:hypothetical protein